MKKQLLLIIIFFVSFSNINVFGQLQSTWTKTLRYTWGPNPPLPYDTLLLGPEKIVDDPNGNLFVLNHELDNDQYLYVLDTLGRSYRTVLVGHIGLSQGYSTFGLTNSAGNGCAYIKESISFGSNPEYTLYTLSASGTLAQIYHWSTPASSMPYTRVFSALANFHNGYYCNVNDTFYDIPSNTLIAGHVIHVFSNDDYLTEDQNLLRKNVSGTTLWSFPLQNYHVAAASATSIYLADDSLKKINSVTGQLLWTRPLPATGVFEPMKLTDGLVSLNNRTITVIDSSGVVSDTNSISLTIVSPTTLAATSDGSIYTGGEFINYTTNGAYRNYSTFLIKLNENAQGVIDSTSFFLAGDADHNSDVSFVKDGLLMAASLGHSTPLLQLNANLEATNTTYSELWPESSACGINYCYSDAVMNGVIDRQDIDFINTSSSSAWFTRSTNDTAGSQIKIAWDNNVYSPGDTIYASVIAGSSGLPTDSFCGISLEPFLIAGTVFSPPFDAQIRNNVIGDTTSNLLYIQSLYPNWNYYLGMILCRTDHQNISLAGDTIARIRAMIDPFASAGSFAVSGSCFMIDAAGCFMPVNVVSDSFNIIINSTNQLFNDASVKVYPNPSSNSINISTSENIKKQIMVTNALGVIVFNSEFSDKQFSIPSNNWKNGIYFLQIESDNSKKYFKIIIEH